MSYYNTPFLRRQNKKIKDFFKQNILLEVPHILARTVFTCILGKNSKTSTGKYAKNIFYQYISIKCVTLEVHSCLSFLFV